MGDNGPSSGAQTKDGDPIDVSDDYSSKFDSEDADCDDGTMMRKLMRGRKMTLPKKTMAILEMTQV